MVEIFLFILVAGLLANFIGASVHEGIFVGALVRPLSHADPILASPQTISSLHACESIGLHLSPIQQNVRITSSRLRTT